MISRIAHHPGILPALIGTTAAWSVLAVGGALPGPCLVTGVLAALAALVAAAVQPGSRAASFGPAIGLAALASLCLLQTVPLPLSWLQSLSPTAADVWGRSLLAMGGEVHHAPVSLDPGATTLEAVKFGSYGAIFVASAVLARIRGAAVGILIVFASGVALSITTAVHEIVGARTLFGVYQPESSFARMSPLLNANNLAGYLNLASLCGIGLLQSTRPAAPRTLLGAGVAFTLLMSLRTASRGGVTCLVVGLVFAAGFSVLAARRRKSLSEVFRATLLVSGAALLFALTVVALTEDSAFWNDLLNQNLGKLEMSGMMASVLSDFRNVGMGRGAFESVFAAYRPERTYHVAYTHPENLAVQWIVEWGAFIGSAALLGFGWAFRPANVGATKTLVHAGAFAGCIALVLQNFVDLGLELSGPAIALSIVLGSLWGDIRVRRSTRRPGLMLRPWVGLLVAAITLSGVGLYLGRGMVSLSEDRETMAARLGTVRTREDATRFRAELAEAILRHPADYYLPLLGAISAVSVRDEPAIPWLQRALERGPTIGRTHLVLAQVLANRGSRKQALLELRLAAEYEPPLGAAVAASAVRLSKDGDELLIAVPAGEPGAKLLDAMVRGIGSTDEALATRLDAEAIVRDPAFRAPRERAAARLLAALTKRSEPCIDRGVCVDELRAHGEALIAANVRSSYGSQLVAHSLMQSDGGEEARRQAQSMLREACKLPDDELSCLQFLATLETDDKVGDLIERYTARACTTKEECAAAWGFAAGVHAGRQSWSQAYQAARHAAEQQPTALRWVEAATFAERARLYGPAAQALDTAQTVAPSTDTEIQRRISELRARLR